MADRNFALDPYDPEAPSAPLRRKRRKHRFTLGLEGMADTQMPQGRMVNGIYVAPSPLQSATAAVAQGLGMRERRMMARDNADAQRTAATEAAEDRNIKRWMAETAMARESRNEELRSSELGLRERELQQRQANEARRAAEFERRQSYRENYKPPAARPRATPAPNVDALIEKYYGSK